MLSNKSFYENCLLKRMTFIGEMKFISAKHKTDQMTNDNTNKKITF